MRNRKNVEINSAYGYSGGYHVSGIAYRIKNTSISRRGVFFCHDIIDISKITIDFSLSAYKFHNTIYSLPDTAGLHNFGRYTSETKSTKK